jgi:predicted membrane protein
MGKSNTADWGVSDITNEYVLTGLRGGGLTLACLLIVMFLGFRNVGRVCRAYEHHKPTNVLAWSMGAMLFAHAMSFFSVSYFGQIVMMYYLTIAMIASMASVTESRLVAARAAKRKQAIASRARAAGFDIPGGPRPAGAQGFPA